MMAIQALRDRVVVASRARCSAADERSAGVMLDVCLCVRYNSACHHTRATSGTMPTSRAHAVKGATLVYEDVLTQIPLFSDLSKRELSTLAVNCRERDYPAGAVLLRQGESGVGLFIIVSGKVHVTQETPSGDTRDLNTFDSGAVLGELSLLDDMPRTATVTAVEPTKAIVIPVWDFRAALRESPDIAIKLLAVVTRRLRAREFGTGQ